MAVASGPTGASELRDAGADHVLQDLTDTARIVSIVTS